MDADPSLPHADGQQSDKLFPIFRKNFNAIGTKAPTFSTLAKPSKDWIPIGDQQYQLDVGQKEFGLRTCPQCEMQYSVHEPEDELLHMEYHNRVKTLSVKGWSKDRAVTQIPEWNGHIIYVCETDSKPKKEKVKEVLAMVDRDLGFATGVVMTPKTLVCICFSLSLALSVFDSVFLCDRPQVYLAIVKDQIVGVCVVQPLKLAHRLKTENGIDCCTTETFDVK